jgi:hypothetical protein
MQHWFAPDVHSIDYNLIIEVHVVLQRELESAGSLGIHLAMVADFCQVLDQLWLDVVMPSSFEKVNQSSSGWVPKSAMQLT